jgi:hypothetical protein
MSDPGSSAPKVLVLHGYVARLRDSSTRVTVYVYLLHTILMCLLSGTVKMRTSLANAWALHIFTLSTDRHDTNFSQVAALRKSFGKDLELGASHSHCSDSETAAVI